MDDAGLLLNVTDEAGLLETGLDETDLLLRGAGTITGWEDIDTLLVDFILALDTELGLKERELEFKERELTAHSDWLLAEDVSIGAIEDIELPKLFGGLLGALLLVDELALLGALEPPLPPQAVNNTVSISSKLNLAFE